MWRSTRLTRRLNYKLQAVAAVVDDLFVVAKWYSGSLKCLQPRILPGVPVPVIFTLRTTYFVSIELLKRIYHQREEIKTDFKKMLENIFKNIHIYV